MDKELIEFVVAELRSVGGLALHIMLLGIPGLNPKTKKGFHPLNVMR